MRRFGLRDDQWSVGVDGLLALADLVSVSGTAVPRVRSRSTNFGQVGCEPQQMPAALKPAFYLVACRSEMSCGFGYSGAGR